MATAIDNKELETKVCGDCSCKGFAAIVKYEIDLKAETVKFTDASQFDTGDSLAKIILHVSDGTGKRKNGDFSTAGGSVTLSLTAFDFNSLILRATVVSKMGCRANVGNYNIGKFASIGPMQHST